MWLCLDGFLPHAEVLSPTCRIAGVQTTPKEYILGDICLDFLVMGMQTGFSLTSTATIKRTINFAIIHPFKVL